MLQHSCMHQNSWALAILNSVFILWTFRLTLQNLQKLLTFPIFLLSITNLLTFSTKLKLKSLLLIILIVMILILRVRYKNNSCIRETQENSIEISLQSSLPYILLPMVCAHYCAPYPKQPCVEHEVNMCCLCYMISFVLKPSTKFPFVPWSVLWLYHQIVTDITVWPINSNPSCSKNRKKIEKK